MSHQDYVVIGAGPAGIQLSYWMKKAGLEHCLIEREDCVGSFFRRYPRHGKLLSINKVHTGFSDEELNLRWDWNSLLSDEAEPLFKQVSREYFPTRETLQEYLQSFVARHQIDVQFGVDVTEIDRTDDDLFSVSCRDGRLLTCRRLVVATGLPKEWQPSFPGAELAEPYGEMSVDPEEFAGQRVLILGKGNSAFETAENLIPTAAAIHMVSPNPVRMAWQTHFVGHLRAVNNNFLDTYHLKSQNAVLDADVLSLVRDDGCFKATFSYRHAHGEVEVLEYDRVLSCAGFCADTSIFGANCRPATTDCGRLPLMTNQWESTNVPGLFFAGTLMQQRDYKRYMSAFIHGFRYNVKALVRFLNQRFHAVPWPADELPRVPGTLCEALLARMNRASALWQQPGFLVDVVQIEAGPGVSAYLEELPIEAARESLEGRWFALSLEYGAQKVADPFNVLRVHRQDVGRAAESTFLHPVIRLFEGGECVATHHVLEDLAAAWLEPEHREPLLRFVVAALEGRSAARAGEGSECEPPGVADAPAQLTERQP